LPGEPTNPRPTLTPEREFAVPGRVVFRSRDRVFAFPISVLPELLKLKPARGRGLAALSAE